MKNSNEIYCSAGTFTGRKNNRNHRLVIEYASQIQCDGFEIMMFGDWYERLDRVTQDYKASGLAYPVVHADKKTGDLAGSPETGAVEKLKELWEINCCFAAEINAKKIVAHLWGLPDSDRNWELIAGRAGRMLDIAKKHGLDLVAENIICSSENPLARVEELARRYPDIGLTIDTRQAQFHQELTETCASFIWEKGFARHLHISDFSGAYKDWNALYPIVEPGKGHVDFPMFFHHLGRHAYSGTITLEAPGVHWETGVDVETLNRCLDFIRNGLGSARTI